MQPKTYQSENVESQKKRPRSLFGSRPRTAKPQQRRRLNSREKAELIAHMDRITRRIGGKKKTNRRRKTRRRTKRRKC